MREIHALGISNPIFCNWAIGQKGNPISLLRLRYHSSFFKKRLLGFKYS
ncbi:hypothetical protein HPHPH1_0488 [Helicobacter pylori Hp H-1]|uniref:Uncharacterized protein n=1 Tax=Helicobacter pylori Hp H-1 TaxID=992058 RepID=M7S4S2_HELPX|nr:hypothetical protein HPHPH1_0488 [Helicobacter pylori Hp H-1]